MGNRAVISFSSSPKAPCIYLHWNGGKASVRGFLDAARSLGIKLDKSREHSIEAQAEAMDAIAKLIARDFFGGEVGRTVYRETMERADKDNWDNGVYYIDSDLNITGRQFKRRDDEIDPEKRQSIYETIILANAVGW